MNQNHDNGRSFWPTGRLVQSFYEFVPHPLGETVIGYTAEKP